MTNQTQERPRLFFTDPIKVMYMIEHFSVKFTTSENPEENGEREIGITDLADGFYCGAHAEKHYVCRESEEIFKPKEGDEVLTIGGHYERSFCRYPVPERLKGKFTGKYEDGTPSEFSGVEIIIRDGKHFFQPTKEEK